MFRKLLTFILVIIVLLSLAAFAISNVLSDNDLANCTELGQGEMCQPADAVVAVSGGDTSARAKKAIELYKKGWAKKIIFSGDSADPTAISNAQAMKLIALDSGVPADDILLDEHSRDTEENAQNSVKILNEIGSNKVILVSSPYHLRRVRMNFISADNKFNYRTAAADDLVWHNWFLTCSGWKIAITELAGIAELNMGGLND